MKEGFVKTLLRHIFGLSVIRYALHHDNNFLAVTKNAFISVLRASR